MTTVSGTKLRPADLRKRAAKLPRVKLAHLPTPLEELPRFSRLLDGPRIFIKRDDCTGLALGGNKARHNEFVFGDALEQGADVVVWGAGVQSNNCRQTAAACTRLGLDCHLVLTRAYHHDGIQGNLLLDHLLGATFEIVDVEIGPELDKCIARAAERLRSEGLRVYEWDRKAVKAKAAVSYAVCMAELTEQLEAIRVAPAALYVCSTASTGAGLVLGRAALRLDYPVRSVLPLRWPWDERADIAAVANDAAELLNLSVRVEPADVETVPDFIGAGYGAVTDECAEAMALLARSEGIILDPVYTGKALAALIADVRNGRYRPTDKVVFLHTGGVPAVFAYQQELLAHLPLP